MKGILENKYSLCSLIETFPNENKIVILTYKVKSDDKPKNNKFNNVTNSTRINRP